MCKAALEALVRHLKTFTLLQGTHTPRSMRDAETKPSEKREKPAFRRRKEENGQTQPQFYGTQYFSVRIALTGQIANFIVCGSLCIAFAVGLRRIWHTGRASVWGPRLFGLFGLGLLIAGVCVTDPGGGYPPGAPLNGHPYTWHGWVHGINGLLLFNVVLPAECFMLAWRFAIDP